MPEGAIAWPEEFAEGCRFHARCPAAQQGNRMQRCSTESPAVQEVSPGHLSACHFAREVQAAPAR